MFNIQQHIETQLPPTSHNLQVVPGGVVCFFPSYQCLSDCKSTLQKSGHLDKISKIKTVFCDEAGSKNSDGILELYSKRVRSAKGNAGAVNTGNVFAVLNFFFILFCARNFCNLHSYRPEYEFKYLNTHKIILKSKIFS